MKKVIVPWIMFIPFLLKAQQGIVWTAGLSWSEVKEKARVENKYIFVDAYTTWCVPCKAMDKDVYGMEIVGNFFNERFLSVKVQMDKTKDDNEEVKRWYTDAETLMHEYNVTAFPTFLFFSPNGRLVHKSSGYRDTSAFVELARYASDPRRIEFYTRLDEYHRGKKDYASLPDLITSTRELLGDIELTRAIAIDYKEHYLDKLSRELLATPAHLKFIQENCYLVTSSSDKFFLLFFEHPQKVDSLVHDRGFSNRFVHWVIAKEQVWDKLFKDDKYSQPTTKHPNWNRIYATISRKFKEHYAKSILSDAKPKFYRAIKDWRTYAEFFEAEMRDNPPRREEGQVGWPWRLNIAAWDVFLNCTDKQVLQKALRWSELSIRLEQPEPNVQYLDTRANLLYKVGRVKEAIAQEEVAFQLTTDGGKQSGDAEYKSFLEKMKRGEPTWNVNK